MKQILAVCAILVALKATGFANQYTYNSSVDDWFSNGLIATNGGVLILAQDNPAGTHQSGYLNMILAQAIGSNTTFPTAALGAFAGATWTAPANEVVVSFTISGNYRSDAPTDFGAAVYGGTAGNPVAGTLLTTDLPTTRNDATNRHTYEWTVNLEASAAIAHLQFNAWQALVEVVTNGDGAPWGYSGVIDRIEITTQAIPEASTVSMGLAGGMALLGFWRFVPSTRGIKGKR